MYIVTTAHKNHKEIQMKKNSLLLVAMLLVLALVSCRRPYQEKRYEVIAPNETAFVIPLEGANKTNQGKFGSEEYLQESKVAAKRIEIPTRFHQNGRRDWEGEWIPTVMVIKVDRSPVTREWTADPSKGTTNKNEAIEVESKESIGFGVGVTVSASIPEEMTSKFLYNYSGKTLADIMDKNVRSFVQDYLSKSFVAFVLDTARTKKAQVFDNLRTEARQFFLKKGIYIENIGAAGQFIYTEKEIQEAINSKFSAEMKVKAAKDEAEAAKEFLKAKSAIEAQKMLDANIALMHAQANYLNKWNGVYPTSMAGDLMGLAAMKITTGK